MDIEKLHIKLYNILLEAMILNQTQAAKIIGVSKQRINSICVGRYVLSREKTLEWSHKLRKAGWY